MPVSKLKFCLVGPGIMPIPPSGWGALERQIWDRACVLGEMGHEGVIVNTPNVDEIIKECLSEKFDAIHIHYDVFYSVIDEIYDKVDCPILFSSHYPYIDQVNMHRRDGYDRIFNYMMENSHKFYNFAVSPKDYYYFLKMGFPQERIFWLMEGTNSSTFRYSEDCKNPDKSIYLGKIEERKKQYKYQSIPNIDFVGKYVPGTSFDPNLPNYKGEWDREQLCNDLTSYANMVLLSDGENGTSLAIKEALVNGLGVVVSQHSMSEIEIGLEFVEVIPEHKLDDIDYVAERIEHNRKVSCSMREQIREYGMKTFALERLIVEYLNNVRRIKNKQNSK